MASLALGAIFLASCRPNTSGTSNTSGTDNPASNSVSVTPTPVKVIDTIFVTGADDKLHHRKVSFPDLDTQLKSGGNPIPALDEIIKLSPQWFPRGTRVEDIKDNGKAITILLSPEFEDAKHWQKGEKITELAVYSLVNTLAKEGKTVTLTLEGKPISTLGEFDASGPLEADPTLNAAPATGTQTAPATTPSGAESQSGASPKSQTTRAASPTPA